MNSLDHGLIPTNLIHFEFNLKIKVHYQKRAKSRRDGETSSDAVRCQ